MVWRASMVQSLWKACFTRRSGRGDRLISFLVTLASFVIPSGVEEWSERDERHRRFCREGSGEGVGRRTSQSLNYLRESEHIERCLDSARHDKRSLSDV